MTIDIDSIKSRLAVVLSEVQQQVVVARCFPPGVLGFHEQMEQIRLGLRQYEPVITFSPSRQEFACLKRKFDESKQWTFWIHDANAGWLIVRGGKFLGTASPLKLQFVLNATEFAVDEQSYFENGDLAFAGIRVKGGKFPACGEGPLFSYHQRDGFEHAQVVENDMVSREVSK